ncbi:MAG TPA: substrate-binding domain-containing protein [Thermomicrobiales bacterium]|jgi:tungstate transport system substrate-binding protein
MVLRCSPPRPTPRLSRAALIACFCLLLTACGASTIPTAPPAAPSAATAVATNSTNASVTRPAPTGTSPTTGTTTRAASPSVGGTATRAGTTPAVAQPTAIPRTGGAKDLILSTTTSTQDSGLLDELLPLFNRQTGYNIKVVSVGSGAAIALGGRGEADVILAHAPDNERQFVASGAGIDRRLVMYNDFIIVGPAEDPAGVKGSTDTLDALKKIAAKGSPFISRGDNSGTQQLELQLWKEAAITPRGQGWYVESGSGMGQTLQIADQRRAYTLADRGTYLTFVNRVKLDLLIERDERLLNVYHVIAVNPARFPAVNSAGARAFSAFILAPDTQRFIGEFGRARYGQPLFTPCADNSCGLKDPKE